MGAYNTFTDNELYLLLAHNNEEAFTILYHRYWKRMLYKAVIKLQSDTDAEEVVQDAFTDIWKSRHSIKIQNSFHTYIAAIIRYKVMAKMASNKWEIADYVEDMYKLHVEDNATEQLTTILDFFSIKVRGDKTKRTSLYGNMVRILLTMFRAIAA